MPSKPLDLPRRILRRLRKTRRAWAEERNHSYDRLTVEVMKRVLTSESGAIDVGCHRGKFLREMVHLAPRGEHYAFEPLPSLSGRLRLEFEGFDNVHIVPVAVGNENRERRFFHVTTSPACSGLRAGWPTRLTERIEELDVTVRRLDDVLPRHYCPAFLKVDVEGGEHAVLEGAAAVIERSRPTIVFEYGQRGANSFGVEAPDTFQLLEGLGLRLFRLDDWLEGRKPLTSTEFVTSVRHLLEFYFLACP